MDNPRDSSLVVRHGAVWLTMLGMAVGGIWWAAGLAGKVENQQAQIAALQATVSERSSVLNKIEGIERDVARLETRQERIHEDLDGFQSQREDYREIIGRQGEHLEATDARLERMDDRLVQVERMLGWRSERGPGTGPDER